MHYLYLHAYIYIDLYIYIQISDRPVDRHAVPGTNRIHRTQTKVYIPWFSIRCILLFETIEAKKNFTNSFNFLKSYKTILKKKKTKFEIVEIVKFLLVKNFIRSKKNFTISIKLLNELLREIFFLDLRYQVKQ